MSTLRKPSQLAAIVLSMALAHTAFAAPPTAAPPAAAKAPAAPAVDKATQLAAFLKASDKAYAGRKMAADAAALKSAAALSAGDFGVLWRRSRHHFTKAAKSRSDGVKKREGKVAWGFADKAIAANGKHPAGYYWATAAIGEFSTGAGLITAIRQGIEGKFKRYAKGAIARGPRYEHGGGYRALGRFYFELPWPKRDVDKSIALLRKAVAKGPHKARNYAWLAESLIKDGEDKQARAVLTKCATVNPRREDYRDGVKFKKVCAKLLAGL
ncbi:MAG: hypothetical protein KC502_14365 [Myxococcales bacterium]|nr:hypothetical protein [Myxococcales bacterium]